MLLTGEDELDRRGYQETRRDAGSFFFRVKSSAIRAFGGCLGSKRR